MNGKLIIISGPSGSGKTTIAKYLLNNNNNLEFSVSACTRPKRLSETDGKDYYFLSKKDFDQKIKNNEFLEWEEVYQGLYYGTLRSEVERIWNNKHHVIFDIDVKGALTIKRVYPEKALSILIKPPSLLKLFERLKKRSTEDDKHLSERTKKAEKELQYESEFDKAIVNKYLETTQKKVQELINTFLIKN